MDSRTGKTLNRYWMKFSSLYYLSFMIPKWLRNVIYILTPKSCNQRLTLSLNSLALVFRIWSRVNIVPWGTTKYCMTLVVVSTYNHFIMLFEIYIITLVVCVTIGHIHGCWASSEFDWEWACPPCRREYPLYQALCMCSSTVSLGAIE